MEELYILFEKELCGLYIDKLEQSHLVIEASGSFKFKTKAQWLESRIPGPSVENDLIFRLDPVSDFRNM